MSVDNVDLVVDFRNVSKLYRTYPTPRHRLLEIITSGRKSYIQETKALDDVSFQLKRGGRLGIVGENGSGKSTLLKILAGVLSPSEGTIGVHGRISALLELGAGFHPELPGRENIKQYCMLHSMHGEEIDRALPEIISFSELGQAIENPVKTYSSGMSIRLGFACAVYVQPDILIVDEALSVGDAYFQNKCLHKIRAMLDDGVSFIYVTHAADSIRSLCDEGLWLKNGKVQLHGSSKEVGAAYQSEVYSRMVGSGHVNVAEDYSIEDVSTSVKPVNFGRQKTFASRVELLRTGSAELLIDDIVVVDEAGVETDSVDFNRPISVRVYFHKISAVAAKCNLGLSLMDTSGNQLIHFSSFTHSIFVSDVPMHIPQVVEFSFHNPLCPGEYGIDAGIGVLTKSPTNENQHLLESVIDFCPGGSRFSVLSPAMDMNKNLWGTTYIDYDAKLISLD